MTPEQITDIIRQTLYTALQICGPMLIVAMIVGFSISLFQSVTQINEMTLTFVPKILIFAVVFGTAFPWMFKVMMKFATNVLVSHWDNLTAVANYAS